MSDNESIIKDEDIEIGFPNHLELMINLQSAMQRDAFGFKFEKMSTEERVEYIRWNVLALTDELHEMLAETSWKPWAKSAFIHEDKAFNELVDVWHFMLNLMMVLKPNLSSEELSAKLTKSYVFKRNLNVRRQDEGYDGVTTKCQGCKRALDDPGMIHGATLRVTRDDEEVAVTHYECASCGFPVDPELAATVGDIESTL